MDGCRDGGGGGEWEKWCFTMLVKIGGGAGELSTAESSIDRSHGNNSNNNNNEDEDGDSLTSTPVSQKQLLRDFLFYSIKPSFS